MYNAITNYPFPRAFNTQPFTTSVEFTPEEVDRITQFCSKEELRQADLGVAGIDDNVRVSRVKFFYPDAQTFWLFDKLNSILYLGNEMMWNFDLNGYESFQYTEYHASENGKYDFHTDIEYGDARSGADPQTRKLSLSLILSEPGVDFEGGEFQVLFGRQPVTCRQSKGSVILFPAWMLHRVTPVTKGVRKSLVVWVTGPKFR